MIVKIDPSWSWKESVEQIEALKDQFDGVLASFLWYELRERNDFIYEVRQQIYALKFDEWKREKLWSYLNGFEKLEVLKKLK